MGGGVLLGSNKPLLTAVHFNFFMCTVKPVALHDTAEFDWPYFTLVYRIYINRLSAPVAEGCNTAIGDKDNRDVCGLSAVDPPLNCGLVSALCSRMLPCCPVLAWLNRSCLAGTVVGCLVAMMLSHWPIKLQHKLFSSQKSAWPLAQKLDVRIEN